MMKALVFEGSGRLDFREIPVPSFESGGAMLKVLTSSICGTDLRIYRFGSDSIRPPRVIGHEVCGVLEQVGRSVKGFREGERVVVAPAIGCGKCPSCRKGVTNMCDRLQTIGFEYDGTFAEYVAIPEQAFRMGNVLKIGERISAEQASLAEPVACCVNGQSYLRILPEDVVVIFGAGFIGCIHAELALRSGAATVLVADVSDGRLEFAGRMIGRIDRINPNRQDIIAHVRDMTGGHGADVIITANPDGKTHRTAMEIAGKRARISLFGGIPGSGFGYLDSNAVHYKELSIHGSHATTPRLVGQVLEWLAAGELELGPYISGEYPLERILEAFESYRNENVMKNVIRP